MFTKSAEFYDAIYSWKDYPAETAKLHQIIQQHKQTPGDALLDVACGTGAHIRYLRENYAVEGLDLDEELLKIARDNFPDVTFHQGNMRSFDLGKTYDVVTCLFSSIGYVKTVAALKQTIDTFAHHTKPGGVIIVEPWFSPGVMQPGRVSAVFVDEPELKIARMHTLTIEGNLSILDFHYLVAVPHNVSHITERHEMGLFTHEEYLVAFRAVGLDVIHDPVGLMDRGLYIGIQAVT